MNILTLMYNYLVFKTNNDMKFVKGTEKKRGDIMV